MPEPEVVAQEPRMELPWTMGTWAGLPQWKCRVCPFDALSEAEMVTHVAAHRAALVGVPKGMITGLSSAGADLGVEPPTGGVLVADRFGNERR